jgi:HicB-like protein involved in pilus formation
MQVAPHLEALLADLRTLAASDEQSASVAERLGSALRASLGLRLLDVLGEAALEVSERLPNGHVEVRLAGTEPTLVYVEEEEDAAAAPTPDEGLSARITLRLPEPLKARIEEAAAREGISVNTWLIRALSRSLSAGPRRSVGSRLTGYGKS